MSNQGYYAHNWSSQPTRSSSTQETATKRHHATALATYPPKKASSLSVVSPRSRPGPNTIVQSLNQLELSQVLPQRERVVLDNPAERYTLPPNHLYHASSLLRNLPNPAPLPPSAPRSSELQLYQTTQDYYKTDETRRGQPDEVFGLSEPRRPVVLENVQPQPGLFFYPNMLDTSLDVIPRYSAPTWLSQSTPYPVTPTPTPPHHRHRQQRSHEWLRAPSTLQKIDEYSPVRYPDITSGENFEPSSVLLRTPVDLEPATGHHAKTAPLSLTSGVVELPADEVPALLPLSITNPPFGMSIPLPAAILSTTEGSHDDPTRIVFSRDPLKTTSKAQHHTPLEIIQSPSSALRTRSLAPFRSEHQIDSNTQPGPPSADLANDDEAEVRLDLDMEDRIIRGHKVGEAVKYDNFYTPANESFYATDPYPPLNPRLKEFRLLRIFPKKTSSDHFKAQNNRNSLHMDALENNRSLITCEMENTSLSRIGDQYTALSYCAGDPRDTAVMIVNGTPFNAFANLEHAIDKLLTHWTSTHSDDEPLLLWADQICIDQSNQEERSAQVQIMRDIYRRCAHTYVCLSNPQTADCLSWVPQIPDSPHRPRSVLGSQDTPTVRRFKDNLLDLLVGKDACKGLRSMPSTAAEFRRKPLKNGRSVPHLNQSPKSSAKTFDTKLPSRSSSDTSASYGETSTSSRNSGTLLHRHTLPSLKASETDLVSLDCLQQSLEAFVNNRWWRRSWVYQEFLSSTSVHFISGSRCIRWSELSGLVDFLCDYADDFLTEIRVDFLSRVTTEMKLKDQQARELELVQRRQEEHKRWRRAQRKAREEEARRSRELEEARRRRIEHEKAQREAEAVNEANKLYQENIERYGQDQRRFEMDRLAQWKKALEMQFRQRAEFEVQQRYQIQQELAEATQKTSQPLKLLAQPMPAISLLRERKRLQNFESEVMRPIDEQIQSAIRFSTGRLRSAELDKINQKYGWRYSDPQRIHTLCSLNQIPDVPEKFSSDTLQPPVKPVDPFSSTSLSGQSSPLPQPPHHSRQRRSKQDRTTRLPDNDLASQSETCREFEDMLDPLLSPEEHSSDLGVGLKASSARSDASDTESLVDLGEIDIDNLRPCEIEQSDKMVRFQNILSQLDRSALSSMANGKRNFKRSSKLTALLRHSRNCAASDSRDRVYAFIGLAEPGYSIIPDYENANKLEQVLIETAKSIIRHEKSLDILQQVHRGRAELGIRLPSWVPDWTSREVSHGIDHLGQEEDISFNAAKSTQASVEFYRHADNGYYEDLKTRAIFVGKIDDIEFDSELSHVLSFKLDGGEVVFGPKAARLDDEVWVLYGASRPVVLRVEHEGRFAYLGDVVICEDTGEVEETKYSPIMYGHMIDQVLNGSASATDIWII